MLSNRVQDIDRGHTDICSWVAQTNKSVVKEHIKPLLVEIFLLLDKVSLTLIDKLVISEIILQALDNIDTHLQVVCAMDVD